MSDTAGFAAPVQRCATPGMGVMLWGGIPNFGISPLYECGCLKEVSIPNDNSDEQSKGNCGRVTNRGEEACECVRKCRPDFAVGRILFKAARLRTETPYKAGSNRRVSTTSRSRSQKFVQVNGELVQRSITLLSGETCQAACELPFAPASKACLKGWNVAEQSTTGKAGVSRGRSTDPRSPIGTGRTER